MIEQMLGITALALGVVLGLWGGLVAYTWRALFHPRFMTLGFTEADGLEKSEFSRDFLDLPWERRRIMGSRGQGLSVHALAAPEKAGPARGTVVLVHGITWTWHGMLKYATIFHRRGYHLVLVDLPRHGASTGDRRFYPAFGFHEKEDLARLMAWLRRGGDGVDPPPPGFATQGPWGLVGESMGAATVLQYAAGDPDLAFVVADCPFDSALEEFRHQLSRTLVPSFLTAGLASMVDALCQWWRGFSLAEASPRAAVAAIRAPLVLVHGREDRYVPTVMSWRLFVARAGNGIVGPWRSADEAWGNLSAGPLALDAPPGSPPTRLVLIPDARHAVSVVEMPEFWEAKVFEVVEGGGAGSLPG